jgi:Rab-like protein 2
VVCVANKIDEDISVTKRHFTFPTKNDIPLYFASASSGVNVVRAFNDSIKMAIQSKLDPKDEAMDELIRLVSSRTSKRSS